MSSDRSSPVEARGPAAAIDGDLETVHIRCGTDIRQSLAAAGFAGDFLPFTDPYCQGPVVGDEDLLDRRAEFLAAAYGGAEGAVRARLRREYRALRALPGRYDRAVLWFEHDSFDQLILARVLTELADWPAGCKLDLICVDRSPGGEPFLGLGRLEPAHLRSLWEKRRSVTRAHGDLARRVWAALREPSPERLFAIAHAPTPPIRQMGGALLRHLQELPDVESGLSLSQLHVLRALEDGALSARRVFADVQRNREALPFLGDLMFWPVLESLCAGTTALLRRDTAALAAEPGDRVYAITAAGRDALAGRFDWLSTEPAVRWVGGVRIAGACPSWRWDPAARAPVRR